MIIVDKLIFNMKDISSMVKFTEGNLFLTIDATRINDVYKIRTKDGDKEVKHGDYVIRINDEGKISYDVINEDDLWAIHWKERNVKDKSSKKEYKILRTEYIANKACPTLIIEYRLKTDLNRTKRTIEFDANNSHENASLMMNELLTKLIEGVEGNA